MRITDLNTAGGIGSNSHYVELGPFRILVDCGMNPKKAGYASIPDFTPVDDHALDLVIITHCHLDHLGALPVLMRHQPQAHLLMSQPSRMLAARLLHNSVNVMSKQRDELNLPELPLFTHREIDQVEHLIVPMPFHRARTFQAHGEEIDITFFPAGHIPGAVGVQLEYKHRKIFFTGDVLFTKQRTVPGAAFPDYEVDTLVLETTRGQVSREPDNDRESEVARLVSTIDHLLSHGGSVLIPVFALGRMQEILTVIAEARHRRKLRHCPIYCAGLGVDLANIFDQISRKTGMVNFRRKVLKDLKIRRLPENLEPGRDPQPAGLYIVSSGMMVEHTPSYRVAASLLEHHHNGICFVGYCDPDTPGGKLLATESEKPFLFEIFDYACPVHAHIEKFDLSGHADRHELLDFALQTSPRSIVLNHGDPEARAWFFDELTDLSASTTIHDPPPLQPLQV